MQLAQATSTLPAEDYSGKDIMVPQPVPPVPPSLDVISDLAGALAYAELGYHQSVAAINAFPKANMAARAAWNIAAGAYFGVYDEIVNKGVTDVGKVVSDLGSANQAWAAAMQIAAPPRSVAAAKPSRAGLFAGLGFLVAGVGSAVTALVLHRRHPRVAVGLASGAGLSLGAGTMTLALRR